MISTSEHTPEKPKRKTSIGRPGKRQRLPGLDLRSSAGRRYTKLFLQLLSEYGEGEIDRVKDLAALRALLEKAQAESLSTDYWLSRRARADVVKLGRLVARREDELRATKVRSDEAPPTLAELAAKHRKGGA